MQGSSIKAFAMARSHSVYRLRRRRRRPAAPLLQDAPDVEVQQNLEHASDDKYRGDEKHFLNQSQGARPARTRAAGPAIGGVVRVHDALVRFAQEQRCATLKGDGSQSLVLFPIYLDAFMPIFVQRESSRSARQTRGPTRSFAGAPAGTPTLMGSLG